MNGTEMSIFFDCCSSTFINSEWEKEGEARKRTELMAVELAHGRYDRNESQ